MGSITSRALAAFTALAAALLLSACSTPPKAGIDQGGVIKGTYGPSTTYQGETYSTLEGRAESTTVLRDGDGGLVLMPGVPFERNQSYVNARELKLKVRELAEQLVADMQDCSLQGTVALPTAFVNLHDFEQTSAFGRLMGEQLFYELNQRGYPVREYRIAGAVKVKKEGEFYLSRALRNVAPGNAVVIVGTYAATPEAVFVNARLVRPRDGRVLRTANLVLENNSILTGMLKKSGGSGNIKLAAGNMIIRDFETATYPPQQVPLSPIDKGADIH